MSFPTPLQPPSDGFDQMENMFLQQLIVDIYKNIQNKDDRFIILATYGMGYQQEVVAEIIGTSQEIVCLRIKKIISRLRNNKQLKNRI